MLSPLQSSYRRISNGNGGGGKSSSPSSVSTPCKCSVCGDVASEHLHYGAICCFSCRAFFRYVKVVMHVMKS